MTHPATKNNHETHKASIVKWYCPNLMGSDTSNYPPWCCWHQWTFINTRALAANSHQPSRNPPGCHRAIESKQSMSVSSESIMRLMISMPVLTLSHPRDTVMPRVTPRDYLASRHTDTRATSPTLWWVSRHLIGLLVSMLASDWLLVAQPWLVICIILASLARHDWARLSTLVIMNIHRPKNGLPVMSDFWDIQISNVIIMAPEISRQHHYVSSH